MKKDEYFQEIARLVGERQMKGEYSQKEMEIFRKGKISGLLEVLRMFGSKKSFAEVSKELEILQNFLRAQTDFRGKQIMLPECDTSLWDDGKYLWEPEELKRFISLAITDLRSRLATARENFRVQQKLLSFYAEFDFDERDGTYEKGEWKANTLRRKEEKNSNG